MGAGLSGRAARAFALQAYPKFAATVSDDGEPNVIPLLSARSVSATEIAFVKFMVWKTRRNFEANGKISLACVGPWGRTYIVAGKFVEWVTEGPLLEQFEGEALFRYNAYMGANMLGMIEVKDVAELPGPGVVMPMLDAAGLFGKSKFADKIAARDPARLRNGSPMPVQVIEKWGRPLAAKFLGMIDDSGEPIAVPHQGLRAPTSDSLIFARPKQSANPLTRLRPGDRLAASVITPDPVAYQVKGTFAGYHTIGADNAGVIKVDRVYAASPPVPGKQIYP